MNNLTPEKYQTVIDTLQSTKKIDDFVDAADLKADDLEGMIKRLSVVADKLTLKSDLVTFKAAVKHLQALNLPLSDDVKKRGSELALTFTEDEKLAQFKPKTPKKRKTLKGELTIEDVQFTVNKTGAVNQKLNAAIDAYNKKHNLQLTKAKLFEPDFKPSHGLKFKIVQ
jgi:hypothetical protein